jgi:hypothetical protein
MLRCLAVLMVVLVAGCRGKPPPPPPLTFDGLASNVTAMLQAGDTNAALVALDAAVTNAAYAAQSGSIFQGMLSLRLRIGRVAEARQLYLDVIGKTPELERGGYGVIGGYYSATRATNELLEWTAQLAAAPLQPELKKRARVNYYGALAGCGQTHKVAGLAAGCLAEFPRADALQILQQAQRILLGARAFDDAGSLLAAVEEEGAAAAEVMEFVHVSKFEWLCAQERWAEAESEFKGALPALSDAALQRALQCGLSPVVESRNPDLVDRFCAAGIAQYPARTNAANYAAGRWVDVAAGRKDAAAVLGRIGHLIERGFATDLLVPLFGRHFYLVADAQDAALLTRLLTTGEAIYAKVAADDARAQLRSLLFDASFLSGDYGRTLGYLKEGLPGRDDEWLRMAENKILAHRALKEGRNAEAVERFSQFMKDLAGSWKEVEVDPATGLRYTKEMSLGFNAARVGRILSDAGNVAGAQASIDEARSFYQAALTNLDAGSREVEYVKRQMAQLPVQDKGEK